MDKKRKLLETLAPLEMPFEKKQDFVNILVEDSSNGGNGIGDDTTNKIVYFDTSFIDDSDQIESLLDYSIIVKEPSNSMSILFNRPNDIYARKPPLAIGIDLSMRLSVENEDGDVNPKPMSIKEMISDENDWILDLPRLTEEEFYDSHMMFFTQDGPGRWLVYKFDENMTWREWASSSYNPGNIFIAQDSWSGKDAVILRDNAGNKFALYVSSTSQMANPDDGLVSGEIYFIWVG